jgi:hypothetical protein
MVSQPTVSISCRCGASRRPVVTVASRVSSSHHTVRLSWWWRQSGRRRPPSTASNSYAITRRASSTSVGAGQRSMRICLMDICVDILTKYTIRKTISRLGIIRTATGNRYRTQQFQSRDDDAEGRYPAGRVTAGAWHDRNPARSLLHPRRRDSSDRNTSATATVAR